MENKQLSMKGVYVFQKEIQTLEKEIKEVKEFLTVRENYLKDLIALNKKYSTGKQKTYREILEEEPTDEM